MVNRSPKPKETIQEKVSNKKAGKRTIESIEKEIKEQLDRWCNLRDGTPCYPLIVPNVNISNQLVDDVFDELRSRNYKKGRLDVIVDSGGGDIHPAHNLALLFRRWGVEQLEFIVPRWAKSAATLLVCGGDKILMSPVAELGPLDPQITAMNILENRIEKFSPLNIDATLELLRDEFENGNEDLAKTLVERLQFPLTLGSYKSSMKISIDYIKMLISSRMYKGDEERAEKIGKKLSHGYVDHGYCIDVGEAQKIGLNVVELDGDLLDVVWSIHKLTREKQALEKAEKQKKLREQLKNLQPELLDMLPNSELLDD